MFLWKILFLLEMFATALALPTFDALDIAELPEEQRDVLLGGRGVLNSSDPLYRRGAILGAEFKWPSTFKQNKKIISIPYIIDNDLGSKTRFEIDRAIKELNQRTCIRIVPRNKETTYVEFVYENGCRAPIGRQEGINVVKLGSGCELKGTVLHEMMHVLGFLHEQNRMDRDKYLNIYEENMKDEAKKQILPTYPQDTQGLPFDFKSIMLYRMTLGAKSSGLVTMEAKKNPAMELGNDNDMSALDIKRVNQHYGCAELADAYKDFDVTVQTSNSWFSGTDAFLYLELIGSNGEESGKSDVAKGRTDYNDFETGANDHYTVAFKNVGIIEKLCIRLAKNPFDNSYFDGWKMDKIIIKDLDLHITYTFNGPRNMNAGDTVEMEPVMQRE